PPVGKDPPTALLAGAGDDRGPAAARGARAADDALRAARGAAGAATLGAARGDRRQGAARGRRGQPAQGDARPARAGRLRSDGSARRRAGTRPGGPRGAGHHRAGPQPAGPGRLRGVVAPALAPRHGRHPGDRADRERRRGQRSARVRARRRRLADAAGPCAPAVRAGPREEPWNRYPPFTPAELVRRLAARHGWVAEGVLVGNGSNELIQATLAVTVGAGTPVVTPVPTFSLYRLLVAVFGGRHVP